MSTSDNVLRVSARSNPGKRDIPDLNEIVLVQTTLAEHFSCRFTRNETISLLPSSENLVIVLLLLFGKRPGDFGSFDRRVLKKGLESVGEGLVLRCRIELRHARGCERLPSAYESEYGR